MGFTAKKTLAKLFLGQKTPERATGRLTDLSDEDLMLAYREGDENAFQLLLSRHHASLFNYLVRYVGSVETAEEILQEVFFRVIRTRKDYKPTAKFTTWLYTLARNLCIDQSRKDRFRNHSSLDEDFDGDDRAPKFERVLGQDGGSESFVDHQEIQKALDVVLQGLKPEQREVFILREYKGVPFDQIAEMTDVSTNTVKSRMRYALKSIQSGLVEKGISLKL